MTRKSNTTPDRDYDVGYRKPPKHSQFKKGQSGNRRGRKREPAEYLKWKDPVFDVLLEDITLAINGEPTEMPAIVAMIKSIRHKVITKGCAKSFKVLVDSAGHGGLLGLWWELKNRKREKDQETMDRELKETLRFIDEELPKFSRHRSETDEDQER